MVGAVLESTAFLQATALTQPKNSPPSPFFVHPFFILRSIFSSREKHLFPMSHSTTLLSIVLLVSSVQARNETVIRGWVQEPDGRGTWSILWSSLVTIFICTWSVLHLRVEHEDRLFLFVRKCLWMFATFLTPEVILIAGADDYLKARASLSALVKWGGPEWTMTHAQFAIDEGFAISESAMNNVSGTSDGNEESTSVSAMSDGSRTSNDNGESTVCYLKHMIRLMETGEISRPPISEKELQSRSNSDWLVKLIAVLQISWFALQTLGRAIQHIQVTSLEVLVVAFIFCSIFTYAFCWSKPQNVEYRVFIKREAKKNPNREANPSIAISTESLSNTSRTLQDQQEISKVTSRQETVQESAMAQSDIERPSPTANCERQDPSQYPRLFGRLDDRRIELILWITGAICTTLFGALHCLAWTLPFPSRTEQLAWRICAVITTSLPPTYITAICFWYWPITWDRLPENGKTLGIIVMVAYGVPRIILIVLAFISLRALPADAYQTVTWTQYLPKFAA